MIRYVVGLGSFREERIALIEVDADGEGAGFGGLIDRLTGQKTAPDLEREGSMGGAFFDVFKR